MSMIPYHEAELAIAQDPKHPRHLLPDLSQCKVGVLDVGCGIGQLFVTTALPTSAPRYGVDVDFEAVRYATERHGHLGSYMVARAEQLPLPDGSVDCYVSRVSLPYTDVPLALKEAARVLVPGGRLWATFHTLGDTVQAVCTTAMGLNPKALLGRALVLLNGTFLQMAGAPLRITRNRESWQSPRSLKMLLGRAGFTQNSVQLRNGQLLAEATRKVAPCATESYPSAAKDMPWL